MHGANTFFKNIEVRIRAQMVMNGDIYRFVILCARGPIIPLSWQFLNKNLTDTG